MSRSVVLRLAVPIALMACRGSGSVSDARRGAIADTVRHAAEAFVAGMNRLDPNVFVGQMDTTPDFAYVENGAVYPSRDSVLRVVRTTFGSLKSYDGVWDDLRVVVLGRDAASVTGRWHATAVDTAGLAMSFAGGWSATYARRGTRWVFVHAHESYNPVPTKPD